MPGQATLAARLVVRQATLVLVVVVLVTACGSGEQSSRQPPKPPTVAKVGSETVTVEEVQTLLAETSRSFELQGRPFPPEGSPYYLDLRDEGVRYLVERSVKEQEAERLSVEVRDGEIDRELAALDRKNVREAMRRTGLTAERLRQDVRDRLVDRGIFKARIGHADETDNLAGARKRLKERFRALIGEARYAEGWTPAARRRSPVPPELQNLTKPDGPCDLKNGTYTFREAWAHGCARDWGVPIPGVDAAPCTEVPVDHFLLGGFSGGEAAIGFDIWSIDDNAGSCSGYPSSTYSVHTSLQPCFPFDGNDPCIKKGLVPTTWVTDG